MVKIGADYRDNPGKCDFCLEDPEVAEEWENEAVNPYILEAEHPDSEPLMVWACFEHAKMLDDVLRRASKDVEQKDAEVKE